MNWKNAVAYYRDLRPDNLKTPKYKHLFLLLYWPIYGLAFLTVERIWPHIWKAITGNELIYDEVVCSLDAYVPFCEWFVIPYYFWFVFLVGIGLYGLFFEIQTFRHFSWFIILSYSAAMITYFIWPNMQNLRIPQESLPDTFLSNIVKGLYNFDTNTNVCPSIHVLGSFAVCFAGLHSKSLKGWGWKVFFIVSAVLISLSTVFLRQHSIIDIVAALIICAICYPIVFFVICRPKDKQTESTIPE